MNRKLLRFALVASLVSLGTVAMPALNAYLKLNGTTTRSFNPEVRSGMMVVSVEHDMLSSAAPVVSPRDAGPGVSASKPIVITKVLDKSSPIIFDAFQKKERIPEATILLYRPAGPGRVEVYMKYTLKDCLISSYSRGIDRPGASVPTETISLNFSKVEFSRMSKIVSADAWKGSN